MKYFLQRIEQISHYLLSGFHKGNYVVKHTQGFLFSLEEI